MQREGSQNFGWRPDLADHRDYSLSDESVRLLLRNLKMRSRKPRELPQSVDWREYCGPIQDQLGLPTSPAQAVVALLQQFERRATGRLLDLSRLFVNSTAHRITGQAIDAEIGLRAVFKAVRRCGVPPEKFWPYDAAHWDLQPDPFTYSFQREFRAMRYVRLDKGATGGPQLLQRLRSFLAAGFTCVFGFSVSDIVTATGEIPWPVIANKILGGHSLTAVGYDDNLRIRSDKGALLVRNCWGTTWGDAGYGWLPYSYVKEGLATDFWTLLKRSWLRSGEFELPHSLNEP